MTATLLRKESSLSPVAKNTGKRVAKAHLATIGEELRRILLEDDAFLPWQAEAIVQVIVDHLRKDEQLSAARLQRGLHAKGFPKDLAHDIAARLSNE